jgi:CRP-like cAMP-binding protein
MIIAFMRFSLGYFRLRRLSVDEKTNGLMRGSSNRETLASSCRELPWTRWLNRNSSGFSAFSGRTFIDISRSGGRVPALRQCNCPAQLAFNRELERVSTSSKSKKMQTGFAFTRLADRLKSVAELSDRELELITRMSCTIAHFASRDRILHKSNEPPSCCLLLQGYLCCRDPKSGQITSIYVPGDLPDFHAIAAPHFDVHLTALGPVVVALVPQAFLHDISSQSANLARAFRRLDLAETSRLRNWIINLGTRDSLARVAHLICEITVRLRAVGLAQDFRLPSPFTQSDLAAACAISPVHANRIIQELRRRNVLEWKSRAIRIVDWRKLVHLARFEPGYLGMRHMNGLLHPPPTLSIARVETSPVPAPS